MLDPGCGGRSEPAAAHLHGRHELDGADEGQGGARGEVEAKGLEEMGRVDLDVHEDVEHLQALRGVDGDWEKMEKMEKMEKGRVRRGWVGSPAPCAAGTPGWGGAPARFSPDNGSPGGSMSTNLITPGAKKPVSPRLSE